MGKTCPKCSVETILPLPPKFSLEDKYSSYRRKAKINELISKGMY